MKPLQKSTSKNQKILVSEHDLDKIRRLMLKTTGMLFDVHKNYYLMSRIEQRCQELGVSTFQEYYATILAEHPDQELSRFIEVMTINETYFFRDYPQLKGFAEVIIPQIIARKRAQNDFNLSIWSAGCSSGEEPYTISIILKEMIEDYSKWTINIIATDIDEVILRKALVGEYSARSVKDVPHDYLKTYFKESPFDLGYYLDADIKKSVQFYRLNLVDFDKMSSLDNFDVIFCRNVLIYFAEEYKQKVIKQFYNKLSSQGYLILGHSEALSIIDKNFDQIKDGEFLSYRRAA